MYEETVKLEVEFDQQSAAKAGEQAGERAEQQANRKTGASQNRGAGIPQKWEREQAQKDRLAFQQYIASARTPAEKLKLYRDEVKNTPAGSVARYKAELDLTKEENKQKDRAERRSMAERAKADRNRLQEQRKAARDQQREAAREAMFRVKAEKKAEREAVRQEARRPLTLADRINLFKSGDPNALRGIPGGQRAMARVSQFQALMGVGPRTAGAAMGGRVAGAAVGGSGAASGIAGALGSAAPLLLGLGVAGLAAGIAIKTMGAIASKAAETLNNLVDTLAPFSAKAQVAEAELDVAEVNSKIKLASVTEDLMVSWLKLKEESLGLLDDFAPEIQLVSDAVQGLVDILRDFVKFFRNEDNDATTEFAKNLIPGVALYKPFSMGADAYAGSKPQQENSFASMNRAMLDDLNMNGSAPPTATQSGSGTAGGGGSQAPAPRYQAPGGGGLSVAIQQNFTQHLNDEGAVDRACEMLRQEVLDAFVKQRDRVDVMASLIGARSTLSMAY